MAPSPNPGARRFDTQRAVVRVIVIEFALNLVIAGVKITVGLLARNLTVLSDGFHGLLDALNNVGGLIAVRFSYLPPDENHPYGHRKIESIMALAIGALMALTSWEILQAVFRRIGAEETIGPAPFDPLFVILLAGTFVANAAIATYEMRQARRYQSLFLEADAAHTRTHMALDLMAIASLSFSGRYPWVDSLLALVVVAYLLWTGWTIARNSTLILTDAMTMDPEPIRSVAAGIPGVQDCHAIRSHGMPDDLQLDLHIVVAEHLSARETQEVESSVRTALFEAFPAVSEVSIHHQTQPRGSERPEPVRRSQGEVDGID